MSSTLVKSESVRRSLVSDSLRPMDYSLPGSTVHRIFQASDSDSEEPACSAGDLGSIPEFGRSPGEGNDNPLQHP